MGRRHRVRVWVAAFALLGGFACNSPLDPVASSSVAVDVIAVEAPGVAAVSDSTSACTADVEAWSVDLIAETVAPRIQTPLDDVLLATVTLSYGWDAAPVTPSSTEPLVATLPILETTTVTFDPIDPDELTDAHFGDRAVVDFVFRGTTIGGQPVSVGGSAMLTVAACP